MIPEDIQVRRDICSDCSRECDVRATFDHADPCAGCPFHVFHAHAECQSPEAPMRGLSDVVAAHRATRRKPSPAVIIQRRVRAYRRAKTPLLKGPERHARRDACAGCPHSEPTGCRGLYRCKLKCRTCGGGDEIRMLMPATKCDEGKWTV